MLLPLGATALLLTGALLAVVLASVRVQKVKECGGDGACVARLERDPMMTAALVMAGAGAAGVALAFVLPAEPMHFTARGKLLLSDF